MKFVGLMAIGVLLISAPTMVLAQDEGVIVKSGV